MRLVLILCTLIYVGIAHAAPDDICVAARKAQCDPNLSKCLNGAASTERTALCMQRFNECAEKKRMPQAQCDRVLSDLEKVKPHRPQGRPW